MVSFRKFGLINNVRLPKEIEEIQDIGRRFYVEGNFMVYIC